MITKIIAPPQPRGPGKTGALRGLAPGRNRGRARHGDEINPVRELPTAGVRGRAKAQTGQTALRVHKLPARLGKQEPCMGPHPETAAGVRGWVKTQTRCANCPPQARGRARLGKGTNPVRVLPTAGARACETRGRNKPGARIAHRRCAGVRGWAKAQTRCASCPPQVRG